VDLRTQTLDLGIDILTIAARREAPVPDLRKHLDAVRASICPYRGLLHFREEDAPFFFGRESAIDELSKAVVRTPLVAVVGVSGRRFVRPLLEKRTGSSSGTPTLEKVARSSTRSLRAAPYLRVCNVYRYMHR
jgi:hypothetical protein